MDTLAATVSATNISFAGLLHNNSSGSDADLADNGLLSRVSWTTPVDPPAWWWPLMGTLVVIGTPMFIATVLYYRRRFNELLAQEASGKRVTPRDIRRLPDVLGFNLFGLLVTIVNLLWCPSSFFLTLWYGPLAAFVWGAVVSPMFTLSFEALVNDNHAYNMLIMEKNGFKQSFVIKCMLLANVTGTLNPISVAFMHCVGMQPTSSLLRVLICIAINLALSDTLTYASHRLLHQHPLIAPAHILHHCCRAPNVTSALVFHPIDLIIEFGVPVTTSNLMSLLVWQDPWICFFSAIVHHAWYVLDHDEFLNLPHVQHHRVVSSVYTAYADFNTMMDKRSKDLVKVALNRRSPKSEAVCVSE